MVIHCVLWKVTSAYYILQFRRFLNVFSLSAIVLLKLNHPSQLTISLEQMFDLSKFGIRPSTYVKRFTISPTHLIRLGDDIAILRSAQKVLRTRLFTAMVYRERLMIYNRSTKSFLLLKFWCSKRGSLGSVLSIENVVLKNYL